MFQARVFGIFGTVCSIWSLLWGIPAVRIAVPPLGQGPFSIFGRRSRGTGIRLEETRRLIRKHLGLLFQNRVPRDGIRQLPWVRNKATVETVQGHVGSCVALAQDIGFILGLSSSRIKKLSDLLWYHELDESGPEGDKSTYSMEEKRAQNWSPRPREEWYDSRIRKYYEEGGRETVVQWLESYIDDEDERVRILALSDEFVLAESPEARLANQIDNFQGVLEAGARFWDMRTKHRRVRKRTLEDSRWNFLNYYAQSKTIMEDPIMVECLEVLRQEVLGP